MNVYAHDFSLLDFNYSDSIAEPYYHRRFSSSLESGIVFHNYGYDGRDVRGKDNYGGRPVQNRSPPKHLHDGTSPLPLGMDWSPSPLKRVLSILRVWLIPYASISPPTFTSLFFWVRIFLCGFW